MPKKQKYKSEDLKKTKPYFTEIASGRSVNITEELDADELRFQVETDPQRLADRLNEDAPIYELALSDNDLQTMLQEAFPDHVRPDADTRRERQLLQERLSREIHSMYMKHNMVLKAYQDRTKQLERQITSAFLFTDFSPEGLAEARDYLRAFESDSTEAQAEALIGMLQKVARIDLTQLDPGKTETYENHLADVMQVAQVGAEAQKYFAFFRQKAPEKLEDPRLQEFLRKANAMYELSGVLKPGLDLLCSSLYPELGFWENPAVADLDTERPAMLHPEDAPGDYAWDDQTEVESTVGEKYIDADGFTQKDGSAYSYLKQAVWVKNMASPLMDRNRTMQERLDAFDRMDDHFQIKQYRKNAPAAQPARTPQLLPKIGVIPLENTETQRLLDDYLYRNGAEGIPQFHPGLPGDVSRLYVKNDRGVFVPACMQGQSRLTESQVRDVLTTSGKYLCFPAGETAPQIFENGKLTKVEKPEALKLGDEAKNRMQKMPAELLEREKQVRKLERAAFSLNRVEQMEKAVFGPSLTDRGSEEGRNYQQVLVDLLAKRPGTEYPDVGGRLSEKDITALTMLSIARPDVNGGKYPTGTPEGNAYGGFSMLVNDFYIQRKNSNTNYFTEWAVSGRQAMATALDRFVKADGDPAALASTVVKGIGVLNLACKNRLQLEGASLAELIPALRVTELLETRPELLAAARTYAESHGVAQQFESDWKECRASAGLFRTMRAGMEAERTLLETSITAVEKDGWVTVEKTEPPKEAVQQARLSSFLKEEYKDYVNRTSLKLGDQQDAIVSEMVEKTAQYQGEEQVKATSGYQAMMDMLLLEEPLSPATQLAYLHEGGLEALNRVVEGAGTPLETEKVLGTLEDYGLIPKAGENAEAFDYDRAISDFNVKYAGSFAPSKDAEAKYKAFAEEYGLEYEDLRDLAANKGISMDEYIRRATAENRRETMTGLEDVKERLRDDKIRELSPEMMCSTFKELNYISATNTDDLKTLGQCETLMNRLYMHMVAYEKLNPEFLQVKDKHLRRQDYLDARDTVRRGVVAVQKLTGRYRGKDAQKDLLPDVPELQVPKKPVPQRGGPSL